MNFTFHRIPVESRKKILLMGTKQVHPAHGMDFPVEIMQKENSDLEGSK
jgi:hypothetical protein